MPLSPGLLGGGSSDAQVSEVELNTSIDPPATYNTPASQLDTFYASETGGSDYTATSEPAISNFSKYLGFTNQGQYDFNYRSFPDDLGSDINSHYMIININVQVNASGDARTNLNQNGFGPATFTPTGQYSQVDQLRGVTTNFAGSLSSFDSAYSTLSGLYNSAMNGGVNGINIPRNTRTIKEAIALYMPMPTVYTHTNVYEEVSLTAFGAQALKLGVSAVGKGLAALITRQLDSAASRGASRVIDAAGNMIRQGAAVMGHPINPKIEVLFSHTPQRAFRLEILMAPKNQKESETVKNIIDTMRFHSAPEIDSIGGIIPTFIPPAEFDISFYHKGLPNTKIPKINTCALEQIEIDYAPTGVYSTFSNGHPVAIRMSLAFRELEILHKQRVVQGY